ncbi:MAG: Spy/CpxP family protein refolding chaperone [Hyphomicrobiaceae bacterium]|nr:Spy/CpxP family protein refolding chaperone [Hyphomicrobiaceae bacterium]
MTNSPGLDAPNSSTPDDSNRKPRRSRRILAAVAGVTLATGIGFFAGGAMSHGFGHGKHFGHGPGFVRVFAPMSADDASDRARRMARHLAIEIDATSEQETKLIALAKAVAADVFPLREKLKEARKKGLDILKSPTVDRTAIEALRAEQMANVDQISRRLTDALADAGEVLTPEQRTRLATRIEEFRERRGWWRGRGHRD